MELIPDASNKLSVGIVNLKTYIENNKDKTNSPDYKAKGFFVGGDAIESAYKIYCSKTL